MADAFLPRVNFETLQQYVGRRVLLVGEVKGMEGSTASLRTSDDAEVRIQTLPGGTSWSETPFVEVLAQVVDARSVREESHINIRGQPVDMRLYNEMIKLSSTKYAQLFAP